MNTWKKADNGRCLLITSSGKVLASAPAPSPTFWTDWAAVQEGGQK